MTVIAAAAPNAGKQLTLFQIKPNQQHFPEEVVLAYHLLDGVCSWRHLNSLRCTVLRASRELPLLPLFWVFFLGSCLFLFLFSFTVFSCSTAVFLLIALCFHSLLPLFPCIPYFSGTKLVIEVDVSVTPFSQTTLTAASRWGDVGARSRSRSRWWAAGALGAAGKVCSRSLAALHVPAREGGKGGVRWEAGHTWGRTAVPILHCLSPCSSLPACLLLQRVGSSLTL